MLLATTSSSSQSSTDLDPTNDDDLQLAISENQNHQQNRLNLIMNYGKELLCIIAFILTTFASVQNNAPKVSRAVSPLPFFSRGSLIEDYFYGQLLPTQNKVTLSDLSFVLYYAPWCAESQHSRAAYEHVARLFYKEAYFFGINCWQPGSECRNQYTKIHSWPILMAYQRNGFGVQYQKNLWTESSLTKFVNSMLNPIQRLNSPDDLLEMMTSKDAAIVAFVDLKTNPRHYKSFYQAALKYIEKDPFDEVGFAVVTGETAIDFGVDRVPTIRAYFWNETLEYSGNATWYSKEITKWVNEHFQQVSMYLSPPGIKTSSLAPFLKQGPVLILFTPRNFYTDLSDPYVMLQQIGMEYFNCNGDNWIQEMARDYLFQRRKENRLNYHSLLKQCREAFKMNYQPEVTSKKCGSISVSFANVLNSSKNFDGKFKTASNFCAVDEIVKEGTCECQTESFSEGTKGHKKYSYDANVRKFMTSMLTNDGDDRSPESIQQYHFRRKCEMIKLAERKSEIMFIDDTDPSPLELITGLACKSNRTFTLLTIDSISFHTFAERLGIDILEMDNKTAAIIMDHENESTFLLDEPVNLNSIARFLYTHHRNGLTRFLRTNSVQYKHTHFFDINEFLTVKKKERQMGREGLSKRNCEMDTGKRKDYHVVIREINSEDFDGAVIRNNRTTVVLFYSANCAFCSIMTHSLLTASRIFEEMPEIEFLRIDGDKNDLPWQYTMSEYPSLIIFPSTAKVESRRFPAKMSINATNVLSFVLANLDRSHRLLGLAMVCSYKRLNSVNDCILSLQSEISDTISFTLREWRKYPRRRVGILRIIKELKQIYLNLFKTKNSCDFMMIKRDVQNFNELWKKLMIH